MGLMSVAKPNVEVCEHITDGSWTEPWWMGRLQPWPHAAVHNRYCTACFDEVVAKRNAALVGHDIDRCDLCFRDVPRTYAVRAMMTGRIDGYGAGADIALDLVGQSCRGCMALRPAADPMMEAVTGPGFLQGPEDMA